MWHKLKTLWTGIRHLSGDDAYERYLKHHAEHHVEEPPLTRADFFKLWQDGKWKGINRCC